MIKKLNYIISDSHISGSLNIDLSKCTGFYDLKREIASQFNVESWELDITNFPKNSNIETIQYFPTLEINVTCSKDIIFNLLDGKQIKVRDSYKMKLNDVFTYFEQNGIYYSNSCIRNNLELFINGRQLLNDDYPFFRLSSGSIVEVRLKGKYIIMKCEQNKFIFSENDKPDEAYQIIFESFGGKFPKDSIEIINEDFNEKIGRCDRLKSGEKYKIIIEYQFKFQNKSNEKDQLTLQMNFFSTVSDAQQILFEILADDNPIRQEYINIYDRYYSSLAADSRKQLKDIMNDQKCIFFEIAKYKTSSQAQKTDTKYKAFYYHIKDPFIYKKIKVDPKNCKTLDDLRSEIASKLKIDKFKIKIQNNPYTKEINNIDDYYDFELEILCCKDAEFKFQDGKKIKVKNSYKMKFKDVFKYFEQNGIYYSNSCIRNNLEMFVNGRQLLNDDYPFFRLASESIVEVRLKGKFIIMKCEQNKFIFSENDKPDEAYQFIFESFGRKVPIEFITIQKEDSNKKIGKFDLLKSSEKYKIIIEYQFKFQNKSNEKDRLIPQMNYFSTILDAQLILSDIFSDGNRIQPKKVIIYDENSMPIKDMKMPLIVIKNYQQCICFRIDQSKDLSKSLETNKEHKTLYYSIRELHIYKRFKIGPKYCGTIFQLEQFIGSLLKIKWTIINIANLKDIKSDADIPEYYTLELNINCEKNVTFQNPIGEKIKVENSYKMKFDDVFQSFRQKGFYYSKSCIDNLEMIKEGISLPREGYPYFGLDYKSFIEVRLKGEYIIMEYKQNKFIFSENDESDEAYQLIYESFGGRVSKDFITIINKVSNEKIIQHYQLKSGEKYKIEIDYQFKFQNINEEEDRLNIRMKYSSTISDAQQLLSEIFWDEYRNQPENVVLYDKYSTPNKIQETTLFDIQRHDGYIRFSIKQKSSKNLEGKSLYKIFYFHINCPYMHRRFNVDPKKCKTMDDLALVIASKLNVNHNQIDITNAPKAKNVEQIKEYYDFEIKNQSCNDLTFQFENGKEIKVKDAYQMKLSDVLGYFRINGIYYSESCIQHNLEMINNEKKLPRNTYPFLFLSDNHIVNVQMKKNTVTIEYDQKQFSFSEGENVYCAKNTIFEVFPEIKYFSLVSIYNDKSSHELEVNYKLNIYDKYTAKIPVTFYFRLSDRLYVSNQKMDYFSTVSDGKERMSVIFEVDPRSIIIYDQNKKEVTDPNVFLKDIQVSYYSIYYNIDNERILSSSHHKKKIKEKEAEESKGKTETKISAPKEINTKQSEESETAKVPSKKKIKIKGPTYTIVQSPKEKVSPSQHKDLEDISEAAKPKEESKIQKSDSKGKMIKIKFIFEDNQYPSFTKEMSTSTTFKEIEKMISKEHEINDKVLLQYKEDDLFINILSTDMKISEMETEISQKTESGATENVLYIKTEKSSKKSKPSLKSFRPKVAPQEEDKTSKSERPFKKKDIEQIKQKTEEEEDVDDDQKSGVSMSYRPVKNKGKNDDLIRNKRAKSSDDDDDSINDSSKLFNSTLSGSKRRKKPSAKNFMPKVTPVKDAKSPKNEEFKIIYKGKDKMISLKPGTTLDDNKELIKEKFGIGSKESIEFRTAPGGKEIEIIQKQPEKQPDIVDLQTRSITEQKSDSKETKPSSDNKPEPPVDDDPLITYKYQTNRSDDICEVKLKESGKVREMKELIGKKNEVPNINNIKILFAGKNLVDDLVVSDLEVGEATLFVYIRSEEDIFLMTANALKVHPNNADEEYEYEYQYEEDEED